MRLIKAQNTNLRTIYGRGVQVDVNDQVYMESTNSIRVPKGTTAQRPANPENGHLRYNTDDNRFEVYEAGGWDGVRLAAPSTYAPITQQNLGLGDAVKVHFGPLDSGDPFYPVPAAAVNVLVLVENVFQLSETNYTLVQNPGTEFSIVSITSVGETTVIELDGAHGLSTDPNAVHEVYIEGVETDPDDQIELLNTDYSSSPGHHNVVSIPSATSLELGVDTTGGIIGNYTANSGRLITYIPGWYIEFTSPPDLGKPVTVIHNFDK